MAVALQFVTWAGEAEVAIQAVMAEMQALKLVGAGTVWEWGEGRMRS